MTDLCEYCEKGKFLKDKIDKFNKIENYPIQETYEIEKMSNDYTESANKLKKIINECQEENLKRQLESKYATLTGTKIKNIELKHVIKYFDNAQVYFF